MRSRLVVFDRWLARELNAVQVSVEGHAQLPAKEACCQGGKTAERLFACERWLREADRRVKRRTHGAPFGLELADQRALALVAIRNVQWHGDGIRVGAGAGLLPESQLEREFDELREKREQVKALLGLRAPVAIEA